MTALLFVFSCVLVAFAAVLLFGIRCKAILGYLLLGFIVRTTLMLLDFSGIFVIPGSDSIAFVRHAKFLSELPWETMKSYFNPTSAFNGYAFYGALVMRVVGFHELVMPAMNLLAGSLVLGFSGATIYQMWGAKAARISTLILAVYPFAAFNSAIALREEFAIAAFTIGLYFILRWVRTGSWPGMLLSLVFLGIATSIHPGFVGAFVGLLAYMVIFLMRSLSILVNGKGVNRAQAVKSTIGAVALVILIGMVTVGGGVSLGKGIVIGGEDEDDAEITELIESRFQRESRGGSGYPSVISTGDPFTQPWLIPARMVYFHFSPFLWDIKSPRHVLGLVSSLLYFFLAYRIYKGWKSLKGREETLLLLLMFGGLTFVFAIGVTNIGTAIRHKTKFLVLILALAASSFSTMRSKFRIKK